MIKASIQGEIDDLWVWSIYSTYKSLQNIKKSFIAYFLIWNYSQENKETRCVCETQKPPMKANSKDGQDHKDIYYDTSEKILSQEMTVCNMAALIFIF